MFSFLFSVPLLSIFFSICCALAAVLFIPPETFGSCFEGSCGYVGLFIVAPLTMLMFLPVSWLLIKRLGNVSKIILWLPIAMFLGTVIWGVVMGWVIAPALLIFAAITTIRQHKALGHPVRELFLQPAARAPSESI